MTKKQRVTVMALVNAIEQTQDAYKPIVGKLGDIESLSAKASAERKTADANLTIALRDVKLMMGRV